MFCPECDAEYREGFTRCADCDVELVSAKSEKSPHTRAASDEERKSSGYSVQLWSGEDPQFYLGLLRSLGAGGVRCLGRPTDSASLGFEVKISESDKALAEWILNSCKEDFESQEDAGDADLEAGDEEASGPVCPLCSGEFDAGTLTCANCGVELRQPGVHPSLGSAGRELCDLPHPQFRAAMLRALREASIPFQNANFFGTDAVLGRRDVQTYSIIVQGADYERGLKMLAQVLTDWEFEPGSGLWASNYAKDVFQPYWPAQANESGFEPADITAAAWTGRNISELIGVVNALREHLIAYWVDVSQPGNAKVLVLPDDEAAATELVQEVSNYPKLSED